MDSRLRRVVRILRIASLLEKVARGVAGISKWMKFWHRLGHSAAEAGKKRGVTDVAVLKWAETWNVGISPDDAVVLVAAFQKGYDSYSRMQMAASASVKRRPQPSP